MRLVVTEPGGEEAPGGALQKVTQPRLPSLDGARALSIALVVLGHAGAVLPDDHWRIKLFLMGHGGADLGVSIFFVLSGYLITRLLLNEATARGTISLRAFYLRRAFRILPAIYAYIVFLAIADRVGLLTVTRQDVWQQVFVLGGGWIQRIFPFPINVLTAVAVASVSYDFIEKPFLRVRDRVLA
jgi:peptidoglycan/LPS O-acetylase OafA/YrhL